MTRPVSFSDFSQGSDGTVAPQGSLAIWLRIQAEVDLAHFVDACCCIVTRGATPRSDRQQNEIVGAMLGSCGETVRLWRRGMTRPPFDHLLVLIIEAASKFGGEYGLLVEIYGNDFARRVWRNS